MSTSNLKKYGKTEKPIQGTRAFMKRFPNFSQDDIKPVSWIIINDNYGIYTNVNLYNGNAGTKFDANIQTYPLKSTSQDKWQDNGYAEVDIATCPVAERVELE